MRDLDAGFFDFLDQIEDAVDGVQIRGRLGDLRADVAVYAHHLQPAQACGMAVGGQRVFVGDAELVVFQASGNVGVRLGVDVGIDAQAHRRDAAHLAGHPMEHIELRFALHIEAADACPQRLRHFGAGLAYPGEDHLGRIAAGGQHPLEFATRDDVKATTGPGEKLQHGQAGVGFHGVADLRLAAGQPSLVGRQRSQHRRLGVDEQGRAPARCQIGQWHLLEHQLLAATVQKGMARQVAAARCGVHLSGRRGARAGRLLRGALGGGFFTGQGQGPLLSAAAEGASDQQRADDAFNA